MVSWLKRARQESGLTPEDCASAIKGSRNTYISRENKPGSLSILEFSSLYAAFNENGKKIAREAMEGIMV